MMRYVNKGSLSIVLFVGYLLQFSLPLGYRPYYLGIFLTVLFFLLGILIYKYKCINLIAGIDSNDEHNENASKYIGKLMFMISFAIGCASILSFFIDEFFTSWYSIIFIGPVLIYSFYCLVKCNQA